MGANGTGSARVAVRPLRGKAFELWRRWRFRSAIGRLHTILSQPASRADNVVGTGR